MNVLFNSHSSEEKLSGSGVRMGKWKLPEVKLKLAGEPLAGGGSSGLPRASWGIALCLVGVGQGSPQATLLGKMQIPG